MHECGKINLDLDPFPSLHKRTNSWCSKVLLLKGVHMAAAAIPLTTRCQRKTPPVSFVSHISMTSRACRPDGHGRIEIEKGQPAARFMCIYLYIHLLVAFGCHYVISWYFNKGHLYTFVHMTVPFWKLNDLRVVHAFQTANLLWLRGLACRNLQDIHAVAFGGHGNYHTFDCCYWSQLPNFKPSRVGFCNSFWLLGNHSPSQHIVI